MLWWRKQESEKKKILEELGTIRQEIGHIRELLERILNEGLLTLRHKAPQATPAEAESEQTTQAEPGSQEETFIEALSPPPVAAPDPQTLVNELSERFRARRLNIERYLLFDGGTPMEEEMYHTSFFIGLHYPVVEPWLSQLRSTLGHPQNIRYSLNGASGDEISVMTNLGMRLYRLRMLGSYEYDRSRSELVAKVDSNPDSINYLSGGWFEMCVFQAVRNVLKSLNMDSALILRDVQLAATGGGHCQLDILIYSRNPTRRLVLLECKSASSLGGEDLQQVRRAVNLLNLSFQRAAVVMPVPPADHLQNQWVERTGASVIGFAHIQDFLSGALR